MENRRVEGNRQEYWSDRDQVLHRTEEQQERDDRARARDPMDYSAIGGPESERSYGRTRNDSGGYPFGAREAAADRDVYGPAISRGGYRKLHRPDYGRFATPEQPSPRRGPVGFKRSDERLREIACELLTDDPEVDATNIEVTVQNSEITLAGYVHTRSEKRRAERLLDELHDAQDVHNHLRVQSPEGTK